ncbi:MAG: hypothetical protein RLZZ252_1046 [Bacteroidota bacterium]|jgi:hypothetical protein
MIFSCFKLPARTSIVIFLIGGLLLTGNWCVSGNAKSVKCYPAVVEQQRPAQPITSSNAVNSEEEDTLGASWYAAPPVNKLLLPEVYLPREWNDSLADFWVDSLRKRWRYEKAVMLRDSISSLPDSTKYFYDSMGVKFNSFVIRPIKDPFDPFSNTLYIRRGQAKFWFVGVSLVFLLLFFYYRSAFVKQFELRIKGVFSSYYFDEMMNDRSFEYQGGSVVVLLMGNLVFSMGVMLYLRFGGFLALNVGWFYWVVFGAVMLGVMILQLIQLLFAFALNMTETVRRQNQRQLNTNFVLALGFLPIFVFVYYNSNLLSSIDIPSLVSFMLIIWIVARSILSFVGLSKDRQLDFTAFLYFCTLEVLPYALFFSLLSKT